MTVCLLILAEVKRTDRYSRHPNNNNNNNNNNNSL